MDNCPLCFEDMDMKSFQDERTCTATCFKLDCGHSFHTKCIIECLTHANHKCPSCNSQKTPSLQLSVEALSDKLMRELKNNPDVKYLIKEYKEASLEFKSSLSQLRKDIKEFARKRGQETKFFEKRNYAKECLRSIKAEMQSVSKLWGTKYLGAMRHGDRWERERRFTSIILGESNRRHYYRIRNASTYFYVNI
jgi:hypothetical protein